MGSFTKLELAQRESIIGGGGSPNPGLSGEQAKRQGPVRVLAGVKATFNGQAIGGDFNKRMTYKSQGRVYRNYKERVQYASDS